MRRARGLIAQACRWLPARALIFVAEGGGPLRPGARLDWCARTSARRPSRAGLTFITRLRLDAALYTSAPARRTGQLGPPAAPRPAAAHPGPAAGRPRHGVARGDVALWYGPRAKAEGEVEITSDTALWYHAGKPPVALRWVLIRDPTGRFAPQALCSPRT